MNELPYQVLDARQIKCIEAVYGGFLYQHLYAVGCLFLEQLFGPYPIVDALSPSIDEAM